MIVDDMFGQVSKSKRIVNRTPKKKWVSLYVWWCPSSESLSWCKEVQYHLGLLGLYQLYLYLMGIINQLITCGGTTL